MDTVCSLLSSICICVADCSIHSLVCSFTAIEPGKEKSKTSRRWEGKERISNRKKRKEGSNDFFCNGQNSELKTNWRESLLAACIAQQCHRDSSNQWNEEQFVQTIRSLMCEHFHSELD